MKAFDSKKYIDLETVEIKKRLAKFDRLYLEIGGHVIKDYHASRVLPGYNKENKLKILSKLKPDCEIIYCVYYKDLISKKNKDYNSNSNIQDLVLSELNYLKNKGFNIAGVAITRVEDPKKISSFKKQLIKNDFPVYEFTPIKGYPNNLDIILGNEGYKKQPHIQIDKKICVVTSPFSNSGKMSVCLSQVYLDNLNKINSGYLKLETFPVWNLPLNHPVNVAYEAATANIQDKNMIDPFHKRAYGIIAVNYNRDIENFKILKKIINKIVPKNNFMRTFKSPTDMGINCIKDAIIDDQKVRQASIKEIYSRYNYYFERYNKGIEKIDTIHRMEEIVAKIKDYRV